MEPNYNAPLMSNEPLLYLSRNSRTSQSRPSNITAANVTPKSVVTQRKKKMGMMLYDFDGTTAPNCLTVTKGELVQIEDDSNVDWYDVRNANKELGFVPAKFVRIVEQQEEERAPKNIVASPRGHQQINAIPIPTSSSSTSSTSSKKELSKFSSKPLPSPVKQQQRPLPVGPKEKTKQMAIVLQAFDGSNIPDTLSVNRGEEVEVVEKSNDEWWDVKNARGELGFVPANFLEMKVIPKKPVPKPPLKQAQIEDFDLDENEVNTIEVFEDVSVFGAVPDNVPLTKAKAPFVPSGPQNVLAPQPLVKTKRKVKKTVQKGGPKQVAPVKVKKKVAVKAAVRKPVCAPIPGTHFIGEFDFEANGERDVISMRKGDLLIAPVGTDVTLEWLFVLNRSTNEKGFVPVSFCKKQ